VDYKHFHRDQKKVNKLSRPAKKRRICNYPSFINFGPCKKRDENEEYIFITLDELEALRLIDLEKLTQEECSEQMGVARSTVQRIYEIAREKLTFSIINGKYIAIEGGDYEICEINQEIETCKKCRRKRHGWKNER